MSLNNLGRTDNLDPPVTAVVVVLDGVAELLEAVVLTEALYEVVSEIV